MREEALNSKISTNNKGFKMLAALGCVEGQGLRKHGTGRTAPIPVNIRTKREGLGQKALKKQQHIKRVKHEQQSQDEIRRIVRLKQAQAKLRTDLNQAQNACEDLDSRNGITYHSLWPITSQPQPISAQALVQENSSTTSTDRLGDTKLTLDSNEGSILDPSTHTDIPQYQHIRSFTDPLGVVYALTRTVNHDPAHPGPGKQGQTEQLEQDIAELTPTEMEDKLDQCVRYLRRQHYYCIFCAHRYESEQELTDLCPGAEDDH